MVKSIDEMFLIPVAGDMMASSHYCEAIYERSCTLYDALVSINIPNDKAKAVIDAMEREMMDKVATKSDLEHVREVLSRDIESLRVATKGDIGHMRELLTKDMEKLNARLDSQTQAITLRLILTAAALVPAIIGAQKLF